MADPARQDAPPPSIGDLLARERRARLLAERRLLWMRGELMRANASLDAHARRLAEELRPLRSQARSAADEMGRAVDAARLADERLHDAFEASPDGFAIYDPELRLVEANSRYLEPFEELEEVRRGIGYARVLELCVDEGIVDVGMLRPEDWVASMVARAREADPEPVVLRFWDGTCTRNVHRRTANGDVLLLSVDITDELEHEAELEEVRHRADTAVRAKASFLSNMSHELRTPLGGILGMSELLEEEGLTDEQREQIAVIRASSRALLAIVDDVLDLGRIDGDHLLLRPGPLDPRALAEEVAQVQRPQALRKGLALEVEVGDGVPERVTGDAARLRQVLSNLAGNAVKFTEAGRVALRVEARGPSAEGVSRLAFSVEDTGIGIAGADLARIFAPFEQAEGERSRTHDGAGLGLTVARRLVELMGGDLVARSEPGRGSRFGFELEMPVASARRGADEGVLPEPAAEPAPAMPFEFRRGEPEPAPAASTEGEVEGGVGSPARRMRVLAAEDNRANSLILKRMLAGLDLDLELVADGIEALEAFGRDRPDLVLMDISMPRMDGTEATRRIREAEGDGPRVPVVALTAHAMAGDEEGIRAAGLDGYLAKPVRKDDLRAIVLANVPPDARSPDAEID